jgi:DNA polymerase
MAKVCRLDYETWSEIDLTKSGTSVYARHPSTEVLMAAYRLDEGPLKQWVPAEGDPMPDDLYEALNDPDCEKRAWNAQFEMQITKHVLKIPVFVRQWKCTMVLALHQSLPGKLSMAAKVVGLGEDKQKDAKGKALMRKFSFPRKPTKANPSTRLHWHEDMAAWQEYLSYNRQDVVAEESVDKRLFDMGQDEWETYWLDQEINGAGLPINRAMVENAIVIYEEALGEALGEMKEITGLANPNSPAQLLPWLQEEGYIFTDLKKGHVVTSLAYFDKKPDHWDEDIWFAYRSSNTLRRVLELRKETSRTSIKKYYALERALDEDDLIRFILQMNGASRTGRYAGRIYQPQNLPRPEGRFEKYQELLAEHVEIMTLAEMKLVHGNPFDVLASTLRPSAQAPSGMIFLDADLSAIENRVLGWMSGCQKILDVFRKKQDPYIAFAHYLYERPYDELFHEYKVLGDKGPRTIAKPGTLGAGYGMGAGEVRENRVTGEIEGTGLIGYAWNMGVKQFTLEDSKHSIDTFRREFSEVKDCWYATERAAKKCIRTGKPTSCGVVKFYRKGPYLCMQLPSGRPLYYCRPRLEMQKTPWGEMRETFTYEGVNDRKQWGRLHMTPGKIVENADQAMSRDLLIHGMHLAKMRGLDVRMHIHDQIVALEPIARAQEKLDLLVECMEEPPSWADGLPLGSEGHLSKMFVKD